MCLKPQVLRNASGDTPRYKASTLGRGLCTEDYQPSSTLPLLCSLLRSSSQLVVT
jgi:hypothetical protein